MTFLGNRVNICSDRSGRTLLAWRRLLVMRRFMPSDLIRLYVTNRQPDGAFVPKRGRERVTSEERREARYKRRKARREEKKAERFSSHDSFEWVFSFRHLYQSYKMSRRNVAWKASVQKYITQAPLNVAKTFRELQEGRFKSRGFYEFDLVERGKKRHIRSVGIEERVVQRCLCDYALIPVIGRQFVYDNGACMKNKGYTFAANRLTQHLREHFRKYGTEGYVLLFDFSKFFDRVSHKLIKGILRREFTDKKIIALTEYFIDAFGDMGVGLGSQISQVFALSSANKLDHFIKDVCRIRGYGRYMDDGYIIYHDKAFLVALLNLIKDICEELGITLNHKKTQIVKLSHGFTFLKIRYYLLPTGKVIKKLARASIVRMRRKMKKFTGMLKTGKMNGADLFQSFQSWRAYASNFNAYRTIQSMSKLYTKLFIYNGEFL